MKCSYKKKGLKKVKPFFKSIEMNETRTTANGDTAIK